MVIKMLSDNDDFSHGLNNYFCLENDMSTVERFLALGERKTYKRGTSLLPIGKPVTQLYYLRQGRAGRLITAANGTEKFIKVICAGGIVGEVLFFRGGNNYDPFIAIENCECILFDEKIVNQIFLKDEQFVHDLIQWFSGRMLSLNNQVTDSLVKTPYYHVCKFLLEFVQAFGEINNAGQLIYQGKLSHYDIAKYTGVHRVSVTNIMKQLQEEHIIQKDRKLLVLLDVTYLKEL